MFPVTFRVRLRFRVQKKLNLSDAEYAIDVAGHEVVLSSEAPDRSIRESEWLVMNTRGFAAEESARQYGHALRTALEVSSAATRLGVDAGKDIATSGLGQSIREAILRETGSLIRDNIHGLDVFADDPNTHIVSFQAAGSVLANPDAFLANRHVDRMYAG